MRKLLTAMLAALAAAATQQANAQGEVDAYGCMGMLTYVGEQCGLDMLPLDDEARLMEELDDVEKTYNLYNAQCREVIYSEYSEDRVNEASALANECADELEKFKADLSRSYSGHACMGLLHSSLDLCVDHKNIDVSEIPALRAAQLRNAHIYNTRCAVYDESGKTLGQRKVRALREKMEDCYMPLYRRAGLL